MAGLLRGCKPGFRSVGSACDGGDGFLAVRTLPPVEKSRASRSRDLRFRVGFGFS
jgi:hypothetical protein